VAVVIYVPLMGGLSCYENESTGFVHLISLTSSSMGAVIRVSSPTKSRRVPPALCEYRVSNVSKFTTRSSQLIPGVQLVERGASISVA
jgi:hypothetical protein